MSSCFDVLPKSILTNKPVLHFVHANGFPAKVYTPLFECWKEYFTLETIELFGTNSNYPIDEHWYSLTLQVRDSIEQACQKHGVSKLVAVGHSVGAMTTLQAISQDPSYVSQAILLDPALLMGGRSLLCYLAKLADKFLNTHYFIDKLVPASQSKYRRDEFASRQSAYQSLKSKSLFSRFDKRCFELYIQHGIVKKGDKLILAIAKKQELAIFRSIPSLYWLYKPVIYRPTTIIAGNNSYFTHLDSYKKAQQQWQLPVIYTQGSHMFVLEHPLDVAKLVLTTIKNQINHHE